MKLSFNNSDFFFNTVLNFLLKLVSIETQGNLGLGRKKSG